MKRDLLQWHIAAIEAINALAEARARLELNDLEGEEQPFIESCSDALSALSALPINFEAVAAAR